MGSRKGIHALIKEGAIKKQLKPKRKSKGESDDEDDEVDIERPEEKKMVGIDVSNLIHMFLHKKHEKTRGQHIRNFFDLILELHELNYQPVFVFDGIVDSSTKSVMSERRIKRLQTSMEILKTIFESPKVGEDKKEIAQKLYMYVYNGLKKKKNISEGLLSLNLDELVKDTHKLDPAIKKIAAKRVSVMGSEVADIIRLAIATGTPYLIATGEADNLLAQLSFHGYFDVVIANDVDLVVLGSKKVWQGVFSFNYHKNGEITEICLSNVLENTGLTYDQLQQVAVLCGTDMSAKDTLLDGIGVVKATKAIREYESIEEALKHDPSVKKAYKASPKFEWKGPLEAIRLTTSPPSKIVTDYLEDEDNFRWWPKEVTQMLTVDATFRAATVKDRLARLEEHHPYAVEGSVPLSKKFDKDKYRFRGVQVEVLMS